jgi:hypothetical protein
VTSTATTTATATATATATTTATTTNTTTTTTATIFWIAVIFPYKYLLLGLAFPIERNFNPMCMIF